jgi:hypothetical protein
MTIEKQTIQLKNSEPFGLPALNYLQWEIVWDPAGEKS